MDNYGAGRPSVVKTTKLLLEEDGWRGFYRGFGPRFLNMSLWGTSMIVTYELISETLHQSCSLSLFSNFFLLGALFTLIILLFMSTLSDFCRAALREARLSSILTTFSQRSRSLKLRNLRQMILFDLFFSFLFYFASQG